MSWLHGILLGFHALLAILIIILTLLHAPKSGGITSIGGASQQLGSSRSAEQTLIQITGTVIGLFFITGFIIGYFFKGF